MAQEIRLGDRRRSERRRATRMEPLAKDQRTTGRRKADRREKTIKKDEEPSLSNLIEVQALLNLLHKKGLVKRDEVREEVKRLLNRKKWT